MARPPLVVAGCGGAVRFEDRRDAGRQLAARLATSGLVNPVVLALPRGGVPVAREVADALAAPLDVLVVRKLGCPGQPELGLGAIGEGGVRVLNEQLVAVVGVGPDALEDVTEREQRELGRRVAAYRGGRPPIEVEGRDVVVVDDGLATGSTARAGIEVVRRRGASKVTLAIPVAPPAAVDDLGTVADEVVCLGAPSQFRSVGNFYRDFSEVSDEDVAALLRSADTSDSDA